LRVDVAVIGGGVAGSTLALVLARAGVDVAVVERRAQFRDRVRGDCLFPWGAAVAARLGIAGLLPKFGARPLPIWQTYDQRMPQPPYDWRSDVPTGDVVWGVDLPRLEASLLREAEAAGARMLRPAKGLRPTRDRDGAFTILVESASSLDTLKARLVVGADGTTSAARAWIGARTTRDPLHHMLGGCLLADVNLDPDVAHVSRFAGGMALIFRHGDDRARAYVVCSPETARSMRGRDAAMQLVGLLDRAFPPGAFSRARPVGPAAFFPGVDIFADRIAGDGVVLIGDAAGANDPAQGQGISLAFRDVEALSGLLLEQIDWQGAIEAFAARRSSWYAPLRAYARWQGPLTTHIGADADEARCRARRAAERDPFRMGYGAIHALGPEGLPVSEEVRRHFLGEDLNDLPGDPLP
jgi:2-polyprenyl-6-methoxyphenol hydroxylase-like FAD-dependent oxidoreductase